MLAYSGHPSHTFYILLVPYLGFALGSFFWLLVDLFGGRTLKAKIIIEDSIFWTDLLNQLYSEKDKAMQTSLTP